MVSQSECQFFSMLAEAGVVPGGGGVAAGLVGDGERWWGGELWSLGCGYVHFFSETLATSLR